MTESSSHIVQEAESIVSAADAPSANSVDPSRANKPSPSEEACPCGCNREETSCLFDEMPDEELLYDLADLFKVFADTTRIKILYALMGHNRCVAAASIHSFFQDRGFVYVNTPIITASDCEGAGEMFRVTALDMEDVPRVSEKAAAESGGELHAGEVDWSRDFFGKPASLTVSGQLNAENFAMAFGDVYTFGPTFRAENSNTKRHAAEFWMVEPEIAFADLEDDMNLAEDMLKHVINEVMDRCPDELAMLNKFVDKGLIERLTHVATSDFARVTYTEAVSILEDAVAKGHTFEYPVSWGIDLQTEHERFLTEEHFKRPTFVTDYPVEIKAFYMRLNDDGKTVAAADCLVPGIGEIIGGSQREERLDVLERRIGELGMDPAQYKYYCDLRRYGSCRHAGFGLGFERLVMYLTGVQNIRDVIPHPRTVGNAEF